jgi:CheY-like chemotaxis protein
LLHKILIVEDNLDSADLLTMMLGMEGYKTLCAGDGQEGFALALQEKPDLIITDIEMPAIDGIELIKKIRNEPQLASTPVIVVTAYHNRMGTQALEAGANKIVRKPFFVDSLLETISDLFIAG